MTEDNICKNCTNHCCRHPLISVSELIHLAKLVNKKTVEMPVKKIDDNFYQMDGKNGICFFFKEGQGCKLKHKDKPIICQLYPFIPHNFKGTEWEVLLDTTCPNWKKWGTKYKEVKAHFDKLRKSSQHWIEEEPNESNSN